MRARARALSPTFARALAADGSARHASRRMGPEGTSWERIVALARALDADVATHRPLDAEAALKLSEAVLALDRSLDAQPTPAVEG